jgi:hypothetical protein
MRRYGFYSALDPHPALVGRHNRAGGCGRCSPALSPEPDAADLAFIVTEVTRKAVSLRGADGS